MSDGSPVPDAPATAPSDIKPCPECRAHKCGNCDGGSWDDANDRPADCPCADDGHPRRDKFGDPQ